MFMRFLGIFIFVSGTLATLCFSCGGAGRFSDFMEDESGLRYKVTEQSESTEKIQTGDILEMELKYWNMKDSLLFDSRELSSSFKMQVKEVSHSGGCFEDALLLTKPGQKIRFLLPADSFYTMTLGKNLPEGVLKDEELIFELKIIRKIDSDEINREREKFLNEMKDLEENLIKNYLAENQIETDPLPSGLYFIIKRQGKGKFPESGNILTVHYVGKFADGRVFDSSYRRNEPFSFSLGRHEVIDAWEEAGAKMKAGSKVLLVVPSSLAYGNEGYGELIPPFTPLIFEIELLEIK